VTPLQLFTLYKKTPDSLHLPSKVQTEMLQRSVVLKTFSQIVKSFICDSSTTIEKNVFRPAYYSVFILTSTSPNGNIATKWGSEDIVPKSWVLHLWLLCSYLINDWNGPIKFHYSEKERWRCCKRVRFWKDWLMEMSPSSVNNLVLLNKLLNQMIW